MNPADTATVSLDIPHSHRDGRDSRDPRDDGHAGTPLLTVAELRACETQAARALPPHTLMARAGAAAARWLAARLDLAAQPIWFAAGPGNNGGDALAAAAKLCRLGLAVEVCLLAEPTAPDARWALAEAQAAGVALRDTAPATFDAYGWLVDGLFGIGLRRPLAGPYAELAARLSTRAREAGRVLALDVPSGLDSDTGLCAGPAGDPAAVAVTATHTLTFIAAKPGLYMNHGRDLAGEIHLATLGLDLDLPATAMRLNAPALFAPALPARAYAANKGTFGSVAIVGGDTGMCGAPILAARAALHIGAGKVHVGLLGRDAPPYDPPFPELMLHPAATLPLASLNALAIGCGLGTTERAAQLLDHALDVLGTPAAAAARVLLDADALNLLAGDARLADKVRRHAERGAPAVITPHPLEAARLLGTDTASVQADRLVAARALAARYGAVAVLKGAGTVIAGPDGRLVVNPTGNAALATGGTGDVLSGMIGALLAQHLPPFEAALAGTYLHGRAAEALCARGDGPAGLAAGELAGAARRLLNRLFNTAPGTTPSAPLY